MLSLWPMMLQSSSAMWGANGEMSIASGSSTSRLVHFWSASSPTAIMKALTEVL